MPDASREKADSPLTRPSLTRYRLAWRHPIWLGAIWRGIGGRLLLLLGVAEAPLVIFTILLALQNSQLQATDAVSHVQAAQAEALVLLGSNLTVAHALAKAAGSLPQDLLANSTECASVLATIAAADQTRIAGLVMADGTGAPLCGGRAGLPTPVVRRVAPDQTQLVPTPAGIAVVRTLAPRLAGAIAVVLRAPTISEPRLSKLALWIAPDHGDWLPIGATPGPGALPASQLQCTNCQRRALSRDGRRFLYSAIDLPRDLGLPGERLIAASDIAAASARTALGLAGRMLELAIFFVVEFLLIAVGVRVVASRPLIRLNQAVERWRQDGYFAEQPAEGEPLEVEQLTRSFRDATRSLEAREQELRAAMARQEHLVQEIHHRVKNNLQIVASLLNLQASRIKVPEARAEFQSARDRVRALATLHRHLYATGEVHNIDMRAFFAELCSQLFQAMNEVERDRIGLDIVAPDVNISSDQAVPIALIVTETVGNALKYAFPDGRRGHIDVHFAVLDDRHATLTVRDDGVGIAERPDAGNEGGLGLQLVRGFARQLGAELSVTTAGGTCYRLAMLIERDRQNTIALGRAAAGR